MMLVGTETSRHCGCRILHELAMGAVVLRIHAGAIADRPTRDEPVQFMLTAPDVDVLIEHLTTIRGQLKQQENENAGS
jgi:hypothetical protein